MNQILYFNKTLEYLEQCLDGAIDEAKVQQISGYSYPLFARVFSIIAGMSLGDYIRYRKLTRAAIDLAHSRGRIIDIALKYGYESHNSFSVAFKNFHGLKPSEIRKGGDYKIFSPLHFSLTIEGGSKMDIKIERKKAFQIAGLSLKNIEVDTKETMEIPKLWQRLIEEKGIDFLLSLGNGQDFGACYDFKSEKNFSYMAGFHVKDVELARSRGLEILEMPEADYATIPLKGKVPECIHQGWKYVIGTFFPENGLKHAGTPDFEVYTEADMESDDYKMWLWIPVEKE